ncbi:unnamed protein product [Penicillium viridicatum]
MIPYPASLLPRWRPVMSSTFEHSGQVITNLFPFDVKETLVCWNMFKLIPWATMYGILDSFGNEAARRKRRARRGKERHDNTYHKQSPPHGVACQFRSRFPEVFYFSPQTSKPDRGVMIDTPLFFRALVYLWWKEDVAAIGVPADENPLPDDFNNKFLRYINISLEGFAEPPNYSFHDVPRSLEAPTWLL